ncbi:NUDIX domain-containing protein [Candidatus Woesearchaeota archaeon]|nr:NUDIX domain-containing protein [Candidatus Woesearchaeota archaeon]
MSGAEEILDVIDRKGNIVGYASKDECHTKGLPHRIAGVILFNDAGEILVQKRSSNKSMGAGKFDFSAAGHVGKGEPLHQAALRELQEELGVTCPLQEKATLLERYQHGSDDMIHLCTLFVGHHNGPFNVLDAEVDSVTFQSLPLIKAAIKKNPEQFCRGFKAAVEVL